MPEKTSNRLESLRCAISQPPGYQEEGPDAYLKAMQDIIAEAAEKDVHLLVLPQGWPGAHVPERVNDDALAIAQELAEKHSMAIIYGSRRAAPGGQFHLTALTISESGTVVDEYMRCSPKGPFWYPSFGVNYVGGDVAPHPVEVHGAKVAVVMCAEIYVPELSRLAMLGGAEIIVNPTCCENGPPTWPTWRNVVETRALENLCYVAACQELRRPGTGLGIIAGPRGVIETAEGLGLRTADLDLTLVRELRAGDDGNPESNGRMSKKLKLFAGGVYYRRPELYQPLMK